MGTVKEITFKNKKIILVDVSHDQKTDYARIIQTMEDAKKLIASKPLKSVLILDNVANIHFNNEVIAAVKKFATHNTPYIKKAAVIGLDGLKKVVYNMIIKFVGRPLMSFDSEQEAMEWLVKEE